MKIVVGIQARTNSSRLPGKVLMPIGGLPLAVLAAKRAAFNSDYDVKILTSIESTDDHLCRILQENNVAYFRGDLNNVLRRFVSAFSDYSDDTVVVRLTADNVFPDSTFINEVVSYFVKNKMSYLCANGDKSGLPYGASLEVIQLECLREADKNVISKFDREHVTPYVRRMNGDSYYKAINDDQYNLLRCTVDNFDDYLRMTSLFSEVANPISIEMSQLIKKLSKRNLQVSSEVNKMALGCVQLGIDYGINNTQGKPEQGLAESMLSEAVHSGVCYLDTARAYGNSEQVIGKWLQTGWKERVKVITKLDPFIELKSDADRDVIDLKVRQSVLQSCLNLGLSELEVLMLHRAEHLKSHNGYILNTLSSIKSEGLIKHLGASVQSPEELNQVLDHVEISFIQLPFNILDERWKECIPKITKVKSERDLTIHVRSVFLQGLLLTKDLSLWEKIAGIKSSEIISWLEQLCLEYNCKNIRELSIKYVKSQSWIDALVLGSENVKQLKENINDITINLFTEEELLNIDKGRPNIPKKLLNPALW